MLYVIQDFSVSQMYEEIKKKKQTAKIQFETIFIKKD
jgi:hypothetical protein